MPGCIASVLDTEIVGKVYPLEIEIVQTPKLVLFPDSDFPIFRRRKLYASDLRSYSSF